MSTTALKLTALFFMLLDHIAEYIPGAPVWLHWIGRISAPLFMFCMLWGFYYTRDRKRYLLRMYLFGLGMAVINIVSNLLIEKPYAKMHNDIFITLFLIGCVIMLLELWIQDRRKGMIYLGGFALFQIASWGLCTWLLPISNVSGIEFYIASILPNVIYAEAGINFIAMGVILYFLREDKVKLSIIYAAFSVLIFLSTFAEAANLGRLIDAEGCQWMMIAALPFMLCYSDKKGKGFKYLFYVFYPLHIVLLFFAGNLLF